MIDSSLALFKKGNYEPAFIITDQIFKLDSNNIELLEFKSSWEAYFKSYKRALRTTICMTKLEPNVPIYQIRTATFYEWLGDTINARPYFTKAIALCNKILDTLNTTHIMNYSAYSIYKALATIFSGDEVSGNKLLWAVYKHDGEDPQTAAFPYLNKSKNELLKIWLNEK